MLLGRACGSVGAARGGDGTDGSTTTAAPQGVQPWPGGRGHRRPDRRSVGSDSDRGPLHACPQTQTDKHPRAERALGDPPAGLHAKFEHRAGYRARLQPLSDVHADEQDVVGRGGCRRRERRLRYEAASARARPDDRRRVVDNRPGTQQRDRVERGRPHDVHRACPAGHPGRQSVQWRTTGRDRRVERAPADHLDGSRLHRARRSRDGTARCREPDRPRPRLVRGTSGAVERRPLEWRDAQIDRAHLPRHRRADEPVSGDVPASRDDRRRGRPRVGVRVPRSRTPCRT